MELRLWTLRLAEADVRIPKPTAIDALQPSYMYLHLIIIYVIMLTNLVRTTAWRIPIHVCVKGFARYLVRDIG